MYTYSIFNSEKDYILPDGKKYYDEVKYNNCDYINYFKTYPNIWKEDLESDNVFYSNYENRSYIKSFSNSIVRDISNKKN